MSLDGLGLWRALALLGVGLSGCSSPNETPPASAGSGGVGGGGASGVPGSSGSPMGGGRGPCAPVSGPGPGNRYATDGWKAAWNVACDFTSYGGCSLVMPPEKAFDGDSDTRSSIGHTHYEHGSPTSQVVGDSFTFDMMSCRTISKLVMWSSTPPTNQGKNDSRDFPDAVDVTVSSDCSSQGDEAAITGSFGAVVATGVAAQPGCLRPDCTLPMTIDIDPPVLAKCVKLELTKVATLGGDIWWSISELEVFE